MPLEGGTLGTINWFHGDSLTWCSTNVGKYLNFVRVYTVNDDGKSIHEDQSPWNFGALYQQRLLKFVAQYLHGRSFNHRSSGNLTR